MKTPDPKQLYTAWAADCGGDTITDLDMVAWSIRQAAKYSDQVAAGDTYAIETTARFMACAEFYEVQAVLNARRAAGWALKALALVQG